MSEPTREQAFEALGKVVADGLSAEDTSALTQAVRRRVLVAAPRARSRLPFALAAAGAGALVAVGVFVFRPGAPITFTVEGAAQARTPTPSDWYESPPVEPVSFQFDDGATVLLRAAGRARVAERTPRGARVTLERGELAVSVPHRESTEWRFDTGPFSVKVTGTRFDVSWSPERQRFRLVMHEGRVLVTGPGVAQPRAVVSGESLELSLEALVPEPTPDPAPQLPAQTLGPTQTPAPQPEPERPSVKPPPPRPSWSDLAARGDFQAAFERAQEKGFAALTRAEPAAKVMLLASAARYAGHAENAQQAWAAVRQRFPGTSHAAHAAFELGRLAQEQHDVATAVTWFTTCYREEPDGDLAREATGRRVELLGEGADLGLAVEAAELYLRRWPQGPHAKLARAVVQGL